MPDTYDEHHAPTDETADLPEQPLDSRDAERVKGGATTSPSGAADTGSPTAGGTTLDRPMDRAWKFF